MSRQRSFSTVALVRLWPALSAAIAAAAALAVAVASAADAVAAEATTQPADRPSAVVANPLAAQSLDLLSATRDRPLFAPSRRPPAQPPAPIVHADAPAPPPEPPSVALFGIVMDGDEARAIVRIGPGGKIVRVRIGDDVGGWKVVEIAARRLVLSLEDRTASFSLFRDSAGPAASPSPAPASTPALPPAPAPGRNRAHGRAVGQLSQ